jgi:hypothetical protein
MSTHYKSFPTDTVKPVWPYEKGQLTPVGPFHSIIRLCKLNVCIRLYAYNNYHFSQQEGARQESILGQHLNTIYNTLIDTNNVTASQVNANILFAKL